MTLEERLDELQEEREYFLTCPEDDFAEGDTREEFVQDVDARISDVLDEMEMAKPATPGDYSCLEEYLFFHPFG